MEKTLVPYNPYGINSRTKRENDNLSKIKRLYPIGTILKVFEVNDPYINLPVGVLGEVVKVDEIGRIYVNIKGNRIITLDHSKDKLVKVNEKKDNKREKIR